LKSIRAETAKNDLSDRSLVITGFCPGIFNGLFYCRQYFFDDAAVAVPFACDQERETDTSYLGRFRRGAVMGFQVD
jgi:hypothetical protein